MSTALQILQRNAYGVMALLFLLAAMLPTLLLPKLASAAQITARSITMSSSEPSASATYEIEFDVATTGNIKGVVVDFCDESPIIGDTDCTLPTGMTVGTSVDATSGFTGGGSWTGGSINSSRTLTVTNASGGSVTTSSTITITVSGFTNPSAEQTFYARILTYADNTDVSSYTATNIADSTDAGGVALATANEINVSATVQEALVFCVSKSAPTAGCSGTDDPNIVLGTGTPVTLDGAAVYDDTIFYQVSTNAAGTTTIRMKGASAALTSGSNTIPAIASANATAAEMIPGNDVGGVAAFGMRSDSGSQTGTGSVTLAAPYNHATNFGNDPNNTDGITSTYGDIISTIAGVAENKNIPLTFGATAAATTAAGIYTASFTLIASPSY